MRWFWIDRFTEFERGQRATAVKVVSLGEDALEDHLPGFPVFPWSLVVEGMAQAGGLLVGEMSGFRERVVLAKVGKAAFHGPAIPGDTITYRVQLDDIRPDGALVSGTTQIGDRLQGEFELMFAHLDHRVQGELFEPAEFLRMLRMMHMYTVGRKEDGSPLDVPPHMLAAERALLSGAN